MADEIDLEKGIKPGQSAAPATDLETIKAMLASAVIEFEEQTLASANSGFGPERRRGDVVLTVERGYVGFVSELLFREDGSLYSIEAYE